MVFRLACAIVALCAVCSAQTPLSLEGAVQTALSQRPEVRAGTQRVEVAEQLRRQAAALPNPRLSFQSENIRGSNFSFGSDADSSAYLSQTLETSGRRKERVAVAAEDLEQSRLESEQIRREIGFRVRRVYWDALAAQFTQELYEQSQSFFQQVVEYHEARFSQGVLAEVDLLRVRLQAEQFRAASENARLRTERAQLELARELGLPQPGPWSLTEKFEELEPPRSNGGNAEVARSRIEGRLAQQDLAIALARAGLERAKGRADLDAVFGYKRTAGLNTAIAGLQLNLPLFDRNRGASAAAMSEVHAAESSLEATRIQLNSELSLARRVHESRLQQVESVFGPMRERAVQIADISRAAYQQGGLDLLRMLDAEKLRVEAQLAWVDALTEYHRSVTELERAEGVEP